MAKVQINLTTISIILLVVVSIVSLCHIDTIKERAAL